MVWSDDILQFQVPLTWVGQGDTQFAELKLRLASKTCVRNVPFDTPGLDDWGIRLKEQDKG